MDYRSIRTAIALLTAVACFAAPLAGRGKQELNHMALVMAVGIDKDEETGDVVVTAQVVRPADARGQTGAPSGGNGSPLWIAEAQGKTIFEAIRNMSRFSSRRIFWAHNKIIVIGESMARDGISDVLDFFTRNHELRMNTWVAVTEGRAAGLVSIETGMEVVPGESLDRQYRYSEYSAAAPRTDLKTVAAAYLSKTANPVITMVRAKKAAINPNTKSGKPNVEQVELVGAAVFRKDKMIGTLSGEESRGLLWFVEHVGSGIYTFPCPDGSGRTASLEMKESRYKITPGYRNGRVSYDIRVRAEMDMVELGCPTGLETDVVMDKLGMQAKEKITAEIEGVVRKAQREHKTDYLDLSKVFQNVYPGKWATIHGEWDEYFVDAAVDVRVEVRVKSPVLLRLPTRPMR